MQDDFDQIDLIKKRMRRRWMQTAKIITRTGMRRGRG
jgi:hypothetical protein